MRIWPFHRRKVQPAPVYTSQADVDRMWKRTDRERLITEQLAASPPYELVNPWETMFDGIKLLFPLFPVRFDYRYSNSYIWLTQSQLDLFRAYARWIYETNCYAQGGLNTLADYTISSGFEPYVQPRKHARNVSDDLVSMCNKHLEDVLNANEWWLLERELFIRCKRDGDVFVRFFAQDDGIPKLRVVEPEQVRQPTGDASSASSFGIVTDPEDRLDVKAFLVWYSQDQPDGEEVPADEMVFWKNHLDANVKRGISDFFPLQDVLDDANKLMRAGRQGEAVRQAIAYVRQWALSTQASITALQAQNTDYQIPQYNVPTPTATGQPLENVTSVQPGEVHDVPEGMEMQPGPVGNAQNLETALHVTLKAAAAKWRVPSWVLTGDVSANFAAALVAESPMVKAREWDQRATIKHYQCIWTRILDIAARQGVLPEDVLDQVEVCAEPKPIAARDLKSETEICEILRRNRLLSKRTWSAREDLDYEEEQANLKAEPPDPPMMPGPGQNGESTTPGAEYAREVNRPE